ncbi:retrovirus-related pol polyprotein from transposon TNT 1-94 [Tanacetum coccineum]
MVTFRTLLVVSLVNNWAVQQLDINNDFLYRDLHEEVYMMAPSRYKKPLPPNTVCKLNKSLYGLKQAPSSLSLLVSYKVMQILLCSLTTKIEMLWFLRNSKGLAMTQRKYALDLIEFAGLQNEKPSKTPLDPRIKLDYTDGEPLLDPSHYRTLVGKLFYLIINRLDIAFAVQLLSQFSQNPHTSHLQALTKVIRYLKLSPGQGLFFPKVNHPVLHAYYDSDWASFPSSKRSVSGFSIFLDLQLIVPTPVRILCDSILRRIAYCCPSVLILFIIGAKDQNMIEGSGVMWGTYIRDKIKAGQIITSYVPTTTQAQTF